MPVNPKLPADQKARILAFARANFLLQDDAVDGPIRQSGYSSAEEWDRLTLSHLPRRPDHEEPSTRFGSTGPHRLQEDFAIAISSATTGAAKAIIINQFSPLATGHAMAAALRISADDGILPMVPLTSHLNLCCSIPASLVSGAPLLIPAPKQ